ncbi:hypothetical protein DAEQUDRAFT_728053 [Daedalea quercina L-15889]|uniref:Zn(2)-C6 fungal-type domain-containing protein n=1 Tax=Daedalea quercina L-15889 TaxID=1314783 RepID=A0A165PIC7_9APHY|nr:hypothetical protein DAEQUDRAFT_728053 [Daedalea quercina L-15889]
MSPRTTTLDEDVHSEEEVIGDEEAGNASGVAGASTAKRTPRACDRCRKSKSRCVPAAGGGDRCKGCVAADTDCTFSGPSFRRGPPKGYIQSLERRLHQMESVLAAIMSSKDTRATALVADLRRDRLANHILDGVDSGPFGPTGRKQRSVDATQDNFFASIVAPTPRQQSDRSRRQSRSTRESVIQRKDDPAATERPTLEWQDRLSESIERWSQSQQAPVPSGSSQPHSARQLARVTDDTSERVRQKRKTTSSAPSHELSWNEMHHTQDTDEDELDDWADAFGHLSLDEHREVRYHGKVSGIHLLAQHQREDRRNFGGIWKFPMSKLWPPVRAGVDEYDQREMTRLEKEATIPMPSAEDQLHLIQLFFTYVNPAFPVLDEGTFMEQYYAEFGHASGVRPPENIAPHPSGADPTVNLQPERMQKMSKLLLFAVFAFAAQYWDTNRAEIFAADARRLLDLVYGESRTSTVQALVLMGVREFGIASVEEGWLHVGMAARMAYDLGLNRNSEKWRNHGREMFTPTEQSIRKKIWWACCLADKYASHHLGRPVIVHEADFSALPPPASETEDEVPWVPMNLDPQGQHITPVPGVRQSYHRALATLAVIHGEIVEKIYPVTRVNAAPRRALMEQIHSRLITWSLELPEALQYSSTSTRPCPPPHVLVLHIQFWSMILLLHRPFIPKCLRSKSPPLPGSAEDPVPWKSFDFCQSAASHISAFSALYHRHYDIRWATPLISTTLQSAGIMHVVALRLRSDDAQAAMGLTQCITVCERMRDVWNTAARVADLLRGAGVQIAVALTAPASPLRKRPAEIVLDEYSAHQAADTTEAQHVPPHSVPSQSYAESSRTHCMPVAPVLPQPQPHQDPQYAPHFMTALLGADYAPTACVAPGYDWWPPVSAAESAASIPQQHVPTTQPLTMPSHPFTFTQEQFSQDFLHGIRDPVLHFPLATPPYTPR